MILIGALMPQFPHSFRNPHFLQSPQLPANLTVAILAGGMGTRLSPAVSDRPTALAQVAGRPFLAWWLDTLDQSGARCVVFCTGHLGNQVRECFGARYKRLELRYSHESEPLGTGGALRHALAEFRSESVLALNGDSYCDVDLGAFWKRHAHRGSAASLVLTPTQDAQDLARVTLQPNGRVDQIQKNDDSEGADWMNAGIYLIQRDLLKSLPNDKPLSLEYDLLPRWLCHGVYGFASAGRFLDISTPETYAGASQFFAPAPKKLAVSPLEAHLHKPSVFSHV